MDLLAVAEGDTVVGDKGGHARDVVDMVLLEVALVDSVEALDVGVSLVLQGVPVKSGGSDLGKSVFLGIMNSFSNRS